MALDETIPIDGDGIETGTKVDEICAAIRALRASLNAGELDKLGFLGNVGIDIVNPSLPLDVKAKAGISSIGGLCIKLTNKTGSNTIAGQLVQAGTATDDSFILSGVDETENIGVVLDSGIGDGSEAWIVNSGIADVAMKDNTAATRGNWVKASSEAGYADSTNATPPGGGIPELDEHMREIGNCIENVTAGGGGTHILARCVLHFN